MDDAEVMNVLQPIRNIYQLPSGSAGHKLELRMVTYERDAICVVIPPNELVDVSVVHPFGNHCEPVLADCHSKEG